MSDTNTVSAKFVLAQRKIWILPAALVGVMIALITVIYVGSVVNPTGHLAGLPVAIVSQDDGATLGGQRVDIGAEIVAGLQGSSKVTTPLALTATTLADAQHRMDTDHAYATVVIPAGFTSSLLQLYGLGATGASSRAGSSALPTITILTNQRAGTMGTSIASNIATSALTAAVGQVTTKLPAAATAPAAPAVPADAAADAAVAALRANPVRIQTQTYRPLPDHSALGLSAFYVALLTVMCGFLGATITNSSIDSGTGFAATEIGPKWRLRRPVPMTRQQTLLAKWAVLSALAPMFVAIMLAVSVVGLHLYAPNVLQLWLFCSFGAITVGLGSLVLLATFGSMGQLLGMLVFLYLSLASSGGTVPIQALPTPLRWAADVEPLRQLLGGTRAIMYYGSSGAAGLTRGVMMTGIGLVFWVVAGLVVTRLYDRRGLARISPEALAYVNQAIERAHVEITDGHLAEV